MKEQATMEDFQKCFLFQLKGIRVEVSNNFLDKNFRVSTMIDKLLLKNEPAVPTTSTLIQFIKSFNQLGVCFDCFTGI